MRRSEPAPRPAVSTGGVEAEPDSRISQLLGDLKEDAARLARQEAELARRELTAAAGTVARDSGAIASGVLLGLAAAVCLIVAGGVVLAWAWSSLGVGPYAATLLGLLTAAVLYLVAGGLLALWGWRHLKQADLTPHHTLASLGELVGFRPSPTRGGPS